ncbi:MAG: DUF1289 domain-containing protein [Pseudomonas sp.]|uniref:DUF1289 domain-containing protein n=1 Tax=Pseudomonadaceae TaxID=135621 RepID=UPI0006B88D73|nr:DUF1289 domain-containing protein [Pseudomonas phenolilytica]MCQ4265772.1 DUF1289 domain-containing protein [Stutzerimonas degradans]MEB2326464.1 DUF1289 domain-containing protein [Pseudomonas sp.]NHW02473.1 DUF1289 domain-containing protein [Stutzerimonas degradans]OOE09279.1 DUF1289 domain-containing protein [Stutzerimonas degradans]UIP86849.1 DUF1289 domain-containing protein [Pseudomonas phenolilytica]
MSDRDKPVSSPCVSLCALDEDDVCVGCQRSADEIRRWGLMDNDERRQVLRQCAERARASGQLI